MRVLLAWSAGRGLWCGVVEPGGERLKGPTLGALCKRIKAPVDTVCITTLRTLRPHERNGAIKAAGATALLETKVIQPSESSTRLSWRKWRAYHESLE